MSKKQIAYELRDFKRINAQMGVQICQIFDKKLMQLSTKINYSRNKLTCNLSKSD